MKKKWYIVEYHGREDDAIGSFDTKKLPVYAENKELAEAAFWGLERTERGEVHHIIRISEIQS